MPTISSSFKSPLFFPFTHPNPIPISSKVKKTSVSCYSTVQKSPEYEKSGTRVQKLVKEFTSLTQPIDRVKRLLDYASMLKPFDESARLPENKVLGCTSQVWIEVKIDEKGKMRFNGDSDSEITKGFIYCLIFLVDGLEPNDVFEINCDDLEVINVGISGRVKSRVNVWNNVLNSMQKRTRDLLDFHCNIPRCDDAVANCNLPQINSWSSLLEVCHQYLEEENVLS